MLTRELIDSIGLALEGREIDEDTIQGLRKAYPEVHFTYCMDDDIHSGTPVLEADKFNLYLVSSSETCLALTGSMENATGLVVAEVIADDDVQGVTG